jgi:hypothetical protein
LSATDCSAYCSDSQRCSGRVVRRTGKSHSFWTWKDGLSRHTCHAPPSSSVLRTRSAQSHITLIPGSRGGTSTKTPSAVGVKRREAGPPGMRTQMSAGGKLTNTPASTSPPPPLPSRPAAREFRAGGGGTGASLTQSSTPHSLISCVSDTT